MGNVLVNHTGSPCISKSWSQFSFYHFFIFSQFKALWDLSSVSVTSTAFIILIQWIQRRLCVQTAGMSDSLLCAPLLHALLTQRGFLELIHEGWQCCLKGNAPKVTQQHHWTVMVESTVTQVLFFIWVFPCYAALFFTTGNIALFTTLHSLDFTHKTYHNCKDNIDIVSFKLILQTCWLIVAYLHIQQIRNNNTVHLVFVSTWWM